jgi:tripartite-type tricarboxylate transporter receptor subunit TctC
VQLTFGAAGSIGSYTKLGKLKPLAVCSAEPSALFPGLPTVAASGVPGFESESYYGLMAPAKTPPVVIKRLNEEAVRFLQSADAKEKLLNISVEAVGSSPEQFAAIIKSEINRMGKLISDTGLRDE